MAVWLDCAGGRHKPQVFGDAAPLALAASIGS
jgi:hypothetical protein